MRKTGWGWLAVAAVVVLATVGVPAGGVPANADIEVAERPPGVLPADGSWTVTLLTGDVVEVSADHEGRVSASISRHTGTMRTLTKPNGDLYVMPVEVTPLLVDVLDVELFNVTGLIRQGYDDASRATVPLIVEGAAAPLAPVSGMTGWVALPSIGAHAVEVPKGDAAATGALLADLGDAMDVGARSIAAMERIWLDRRVTTTSLTEPGQRPPRLDPNLTQVGADDAWAAGLTGDGVRVAVLDTGVDPDHPDLAGQVVAQENFSESPDTVDRVGHGTHVASLVAGTGAAAGGARRGVAPDADLLIGKVLNDGGWGMESDIIAGMEWAAPQADVVNMSLGDDWPTDGSDPLSTAVDQLSATHGTLFVVAAGNAGPGSTSIGSPGAADSALTVGAVDASDTVADFSSRGPLFESNELKPEVVAPGVDVVAARAGQTAMGEPVDANYTRASGTSMATPHVAGAAALLAQQHPDWTGNQLKGALIGSADPIGADGYDAGTGRIDAGDGMSAGVLAERDVVDVVLPHPRTGPHGETLAWTNTGTEPATVSFAAEVADRSGEPVEAVTVSPSSLVLAPGATGAVTVTVDGASLDAGLYSGTVSASLPDGTDSRQPLGIHAQPEMATLTIEATPPEGGVGEPYGGITILNLDDAATFANLDYFYSGHSVSVDVPVGRYAVIGDVTGYDFDQDVTAQVGDPDVQIDGATTVAFDGKAAVPLNPSVEGVEAMPVATEVGLVLTPRAGTGGFGYGMGMYSWYPAPPIFVQPMEGDPELVSPRPTVARLLAEPLQVSAGGTPIDAKLVVNHLPPTGSQTLAAVDVGDGADLAPARGGLAVVTLPADRNERAALTHRAVEAGVVMLAFVDETRPLLTLEPSFGGPWADIPAIGVASTSATALRAAARAGQPVTVTVTPSPFVYDLVFPASDDFDPNPVIDRAARRRLAVLEETFHHDLGGPEIPAERRRALSVSLLELDTVGPLPAERRAYVTPGVTWQSYVFGDGYLWFPGAPFPFPAAVATSISAETSYARGSRQDLEWQRRPMAPGPAGAPLGRNFCQPLPTTRTVDLMHVELEPYQDRVDGFSCNDPAAATMTVRRNGEVLGTVVGPPILDVSVPAERGDFEIVYEQEGASPYPHRSTTTWSFPSSCCDASVGSVRLPLLVVDYGLPLDESNRLTGTTAHIRVRQVTGSRERRITGLSVWTSLDDGATWSAAPVRRGRDGFTVTLPAATAGTGVSLRVDAVDAGGSRIDQTVFDAYIA